MTRSERKSLIVSRLSAIACSVLLIAPSRASIASSVRLGSMFRAA